MTGVHYRTATLPELPIVLDWAAAEGWNPGLGDAGAFYAADPEGFFVAEAGRRIVAAISVVNHSAEVAFLGLYLCVPEWRGKGIGFGLWTHALAHAGARSVSLDGVAAQEANYARSGFVRTGATVRFEGVLAGQGGDRVSPMADGDREAVAALDLRANGYARPEFLGAWITGTETRQTFVLENAGSPVGFATGRLCRSGLKAGPVVAETAQDAMTLLAAVADWGHGAVMSVDVPSANTALVSDLRDAGFVDTFATARMVRGTVPEAGPTLQAIATMELG